MLSSDDGTVLTRRSLRARKARPFKSTPEELERIQQLLSRSEGRMAERAKIILAAFEGRDAAQTASELRVSLLTVYKWRRRYREHGASGLRDRPRQGQPRKLDRQRVSEIEAVTRHCVPPRAALWSIRRLAATMSVTTHQVRRIWSDMGIDTRSFRGRRALDDLVRSCAAYEVLGLCMSPPHNALVLGTTQVTANSLLGTVSEPRRNIESLGERRRARGNVWGAFDASAGGLRARVDSGSATLIDFLQRVRAGVSGSDRLEVVLSAPESSHDSAVAALLGREARDDSRMSVRVVWPATTWLCVLDGWLSMTDSVSARRSNPNLLRLREALTRHAATPSGRPFVWVVPRLDVS